MSGLHYNLSYQEYNDIPATRQSALKVIASKSELHYQLDLETPHRTSTAMLIGQVTDALICAGGNLGDTKYVAMPDFANDGLNVTDKRRTPSTSPLTKYVQNRTEDFKRANPSKIVVKQEYLEKAQGAADAVLHDRVAQEVMRDTSQQVCATGTIEQIECKGLMDLYKPGMIADIKTTRSVEMYSFGRQFAQLRYAFQLQFYRMLVEMVGPIVSEVYLITVENEPPHDVAVVPVPMIVLDNAEHSIVDALIRLRTARSKKQWPGIARGKMYELHIPQWSMPEDELFIEG